MKFTIVKKLGLGFGLCAAIFVAIVVIGVVNRSQLSRLHDTGSKRTNDAIESANMANMGDVLYVVIADAIITGEPAKEEKAWNELTLRLDRQLELMKQVVDTPEEQATLARASREYLTIKTIVVNELFPQLKANGSPKRIKAVVERISRQKEVFRSQFEQMEELLQKENRAAQVAFGAKMAWARTLVIIMGGLGLAIASFVAWYVSAGIKKSVMQGVAFAEALQQGDLGNRIDALPNDEVGDLCRALNSAADSLEGKALYADAIAAGDLSRDVTLASPQDALGRALNQMIAALRLGREQAEERDWFKSGQNELGALLRGEQEVGPMAERVLTFLAEFLKAGVGAFYLFDKRESLLILTASYAFTRRKDLGDRFRLGEGLIGQAALEKKMICLTDVPADYLQIGSALFDAVPQAVVAFPLVHNGRLVGALELGSFHAFGRLELDFLNRAAEGIAIAVGVAHSRQLINELLEKTQQQAEELRVQQEELQQSNEELEERAQLLEQQKAQIHVTNLEVEATSSELKNKAEELERVSTYKSEFLANMSHELRTPLNSMMILSRLLTENKEGTLTERQQEFAATINGAGADLLNLINDILDLSKVEAGRMEFHLEQVPLTALCEPVTAMFAPLAEQKGLSFSVTIDDNVPHTLLTDQQRTQQILNNLLSNALKFTRQGSVTLCVKALISRDNPLHRPAIAFVVRDTGTGIPADKRELIFRAFQQGDGTTSRKFGGTGLGLSISLELAHRLGGDIRLVSAEGEGSEFTCYLPQTGPVTAAVSAVPVSSSLVVSQARTTLPYTSTRPPDPADPLTTSSLEDDREQLTTAERSILIIEDDKNFAKILLEMVRERGFAGLVATDGESGINLAQRYRPNAIILDVKLPGIDGYGVMLGLKDSPHTRHIPVHFVTCLEDRKRAMAMGAVGFITKPVNPEQINEVCLALEKAIDKTVKKLLIVEDNQLEARSMVSLLEGRDVAIVVAASGAEAIRLLAAEPVDCIVLDLGLSDMSGFDLLAHIQALDEARRTPVIIHTGRVLSHEEESQLQRFAESIIIKGAKSPERLLNEVSLFLHMVEDELPPEKQLMIRASLNQETMLAGKKVLLVDDDMRNIFSLSAMLAEKNMWVIEAENGREALARLEEHPDVNIVLMDIMMPEMDGYEATRAIRSNPGFSGLPIIAMTAKALKGDHEKCLRAGTNDYIAKPIDVDKLFSLMRVWLYQQATSVGRS